MGKLRCYADIPNCHYETQSWIDYTNHISIHRGNHYYED